MVAARSRAEIPRQANQDLALMTPPTPLPCSITMQQGLDICTNISNKIHPRRPSHRPQDRTFAYGPPWFKDLFQRRSTADPMVQARVDLGIKSHSVHSELVRARLVRGIMFAWSQSPLLHINTLAPRDPGCRKNPCGGQDLRGRNHQIIRNVTLILPSPFETSSSSLGTLDKGCGDQLQAWPMNTVSRPTHGT